MCMCQPQTPDLSLSPFNILKNKNIQMPYKLREEIEINFRVLEIDIEKKESYFR